MKSVRRPRVDVALNYASHGHSPKNLIVLHETISPDYPGLKDLIGVGGYLGHVGYGIHVITDAEGNSAAVLPREETAIYYHAASGTLEANTRGIGIEQIGYTTSNWWKRARQLNKTARWCAYLGKQHNIPMVYDPTCKTGICGHADVTRAGRVPGGHTDCTYPAYPTKFVAQLARNYRRFGWA